MKLLILTILAIGSFAHAGTQYAPNDCIKYLVGILGSQYTFVSHDLITRTEKNGDLSVFNAKGASVRVQPNGGCYPLKNKVDDYMGAVLGAYLKAKKEVSPEQVAKDNKKSEETGDPVWIQGHPSDAIAACDSQEKNSDWWKLAQEGAKFETPKSKSTH